MSSRKRPCAIIAFVSAILLIAGAVLWLVFISGRTPQTAFQPTCEGYEQAALAACTRAMDVYWSAKRGLYESPVLTSSLTNIMMVQAFSILAGRDLLPGRYIDRCRDLLAKLLAPPLSLAFGGVSFYMDRYADAHISVSGPFCTALYYSWKNASKLGLDDEMVASLGERALQEMQWIRGRLFANLTGSNQTALRWGLEAAHAAWMMTGSSSAIAVAQDCLNAFARYYKEVPDELYERPWINPDWTWVYDPTLPRQMGPENGDTGITCSRAEYNFTYLSHCATGAAFYQRIGGRFPDGALEALAALFARSLSQWTMAGYPNWISTQRDQRAFSTNYWIWCLYSLTAMTTWEGWSMDQRSLSRAVLDNAVELFCKDFLCGGTSDEEDMANPYGVKIYESGSLNRHPDLAISMFAAYVAMAVDWNVFDVEPMCSPSVWGWEQEARNLYASTSAYSAASGSDVLTAYYEDRADITLLYHGNGRLLGPAYVDTREEPRHWAFTIEGDSPGSGTILRTDRDAPDDVAILCDGARILPMSYSTDLQPAGFSSLKKESSWDSIPGQASLVLEFREDSIVRSFSYAGDVGHGPYSWTAVLPSRYALRAVDIVSAEGLTSLDLSTESVVAATDLRTIHFRYDGYGVLYSLSGPAQRFQVTSSDSAKWDWDTRTGPIIMIDGASFEQCIDVEFIIHFTDGTAVSRDGTWQPYRASDGSSAP